MILLTLLFEITLTKQKNIWKTNLQKICQALFKKNRCLFTKYKTNRLFEESSKVIFAVVEMFDIGFQL